MKTLTQDTQAYKKLNFNFRKNREQDNTEMMDSLASQFEYLKNSDQYWNPENFSFLYGTPLWDGATDRQRKVLNHLYWVAYYSQIISAEIATIFFNQTSAAGLYGIENFRMVCDTLDLESMQERAHINAFKTISEATEAHLFGERIFSYPMRGPYVETMMYKDVGPFLKFWRGLQLRAFTLISSSNAFLACQYFTVRGLRTLNGKLVQHQLSQFHSKSTQKELSAVPAQVSYYHFLDESFHFNSSTIISHDILQFVPQPTKYEAWMANQGIMGTQKDHFSFSAAINGLFWHDPALYPKVYRVLKSPVFGFSDADAAEMMKKCFGQETEALHLSNKSRIVAMESYRNYLSDLDYVSAQNKEMKLMAENSLERQLHTNQKALKIFFGKKRFENWGSIPLQEAIN